MEILSAKPPLYALQMVMPAVAVAIGMALAEREPLTAHGSRLFKFYWAGALFHALVPALGLAGFLVFWSMLPIPWTPLLLALIVAAGVVAAHIGILAGRLYAWLGLSIASSLLIYVAVFQLTVPLYDGVWTSSRLGDTARAIAPCVPGRPLIAGYGEPSAVFDMGTWTYVTKGPDAGQSAANWLDERKGRIAFVARRIDQEFHDHVRRIGLQPPLRVACIKGFNAGRFKWTDISLYVAADKSELAACRLPDFARCGTQD